jgi:MPBQ/MSBQ methyltransferase
MNTIKSRATTHKNVIDYYEKAGLDYEVWSPNFNMHFGYYKWGMNPFNLEKMLNQMNEEVINRLFLEEHIDPLVLDLGCGVGATARYLAKRNFEATVYGVTVTPWQVVFGNRLNHNAFLANQIDICLADFNDLPLATECSDGAYAVESACYGNGPAKKEFVNELYRTLKPGARFVVADGFRKHSNRLPGILDTIYKRNMKYWALTELADIQLFKKELENVGFKNIVVEDISWKVAPSFVHIPKTVIKFLWKRCLEKDEKTLVTERKNNALAPLYGMLMGLARKHFGYYLISGEKPTC